MPLTSDEIVARAPRIRLWLMARPGDEQMHRAGLAPAVADAVSELREAAHYLTARQGGGGAVREASELILKSHDSQDSQDRWIQAVSTYNL